MQRDRVEVPGAVVERFVEPSSVAGVEEVVGRAAREGESLLIAGGRTRLHWANFARSISLGLSMRGLSGIDEFEPEEGVVHAAAGTPVDEVRKAVLAEGWELPIDVPGRASTIGGVIATAATGPRAQVFGRVSDAILGLEVVGADGVASKCGGRVVKNVTGYDLAKLYCGSFGTLAVITGAWLRLRPRPAIQRAFVVERQELGSEQDFERCRGLAKLGSVRALIWREGSTLGEDGGCEVLVELGGAEAEVAHDCERIGERLPLVEVPIERIDALRDGRIEDRGDGLVLRARVLGAKCGELAAAMREAGLGLEVDPGVGVVQARGALDSLAELLSLRARVEDLGGIATFEVVPEAWRQELDVFGDPGEARVLMAEIKRRFDPHGRLNPGRFVAGI
jgi:glycolate oxidase FAD binding subunit